MSAHPAMKRRTEADLAARVPVAETAIDEALRLPTPALREAALGALIYGSTREDRYLTTQLIIARLSGYRLSTEQS